MSRIPLAPTLALALAALAPAAAADPFVFVSLPDTQIYAENRLPHPTRTPAVTDPRGTGAIFFDQTRWIVDNAAALDIRYVGHLGDIVQNGDQIVEWERAEQAMQLLLDADIPHGTVMGNHDDTSHPPTYQSNYLAYFGPQVYEGRSWYTASSPSGGANLQMLRHGPYKLGFLNFSIDHPRSEVEWATDLVQANPDTIFVIGTHRYLYDFKVGGGRYEEVVETELGLTIQIPQGAVPGVTDGLSAEELFQQFVRVNPNVLMIHAGHFHAEWLRLDESNDAGHPIVQILTDYQSTRNGGDGYLRVYEIDFDADQLRFHTYSPTLDRRRTVIDHFVETIYLVWDERQQIKDLLGISDDGVYLQAIRVILKNSPSVPDDFLDAHPDYDELHERAYYDQYMSDLFHGNVPPDFQDITTWKNLWLLGFASDRADLGDFSDGPRSPSGVVDLDLSAYFTPSPEQQLAFAVEGLVDAAGALAPDDVLVSALVWVIRGFVEHAERLVADGKARQAAHLLRVQLLKRIDGCALRGEPDAMTRSLARGDWVTSCDAQAALHEHAQEVLDLVAAAGP